VVGEKTRRAERGVKGLLGRRKSSGRSDVRVLPRRASWQAVVDLAVEVRSG